MKRGEARASVEAYPLPYDLRLERLVLGWVFLQDGFWDTADLREHDFWVPLHRKVFRGVERLLQREATIDTVTVEREIERTEGKLSLDDVEGMLSLTDEIRPVSTAAVQRLKELAQCRAVLEASMGLGRAAVERGNLDDVRTVVEAMMEAAEVRSDRPHTTTAHEIGKEFLEELRSGDTSRSVHPGMKPFVEKLGRLPTGSVTTVGAPTNVGKSTFGISLMRDATIAGTRCGYIGCEDPKSLVAARFLAMESGISARLMQRDDVATLDLGTLQKAVAKLEATPYDIDFCQGLDHLAVVAAMRRQARRGCKLILVDYVQAVEYAGGYVQDRRNEVRLIVNRLKREAVRLDVALVIFSQLKRLEAGRGGKLKEPTKHDLKEAGDIENASEFILMLWRDKEQDQADLHVKVAKAKSGGVGFTWDMERLESGLLVVRDRRMRVPADVGRFF